MEVLFYISVDCLPFQVEKKLDPFMFENLEDGRPLCVANNDEIIAMNQEARALGIEYGVCVPDAVSTQHARLHIVQITWESVEGKSHKMLFEMARESIATCLRGFCSKDVVTRHSDVETLYILHLGSRELLLSASAAPQAGQEYLKKFSELLPYKARNQTHEKGACAHFDTEINTLLSAGEILAHHIRSILKECLAYDSTVGVGSSESHAAEALQFARDKGIHVHTLYGSSGDVEDSGPASHASPVYLSMPTRTQKTPLRCEDPPSQASVEILSGPTYDIHFVHLLYALTGECDYRDTEHFMKENGMHEAAAKLFYAD